jgi:hypothetical protein
MKKGILQALFISSIFLINLVSASFHYGYGRFSFRGFIDGFDPVTLSLGLLFIVFLLVLNNLVFINLFRDQKGVAFVVSASISLLAVYWMYQKGLYLDEAIIFPVLIASMAVIVISYILINGFKMNRAMSIIIAVAISGAIAFWAYTSNFSLPSDILFPIVSFLLALGVIISIWKKKFSWLLIISGLLLILTTIFTDIFYEKGIALIAGIVLLVLGIFLKRRGGKQRDKEPKINLRKLRESKELEAHIENAMRDKAKRRQAARQQRSPQTSQRTPQQPTAQQSGKNRNKLARKLGISKLQKEVQRLSQELQGGLQKAGNLHTKSTSLGWNKTKEGNKYYKSWFRQYNQNIQNEKKIREIQARIQRLQNRLNRS